MAYHLPHMYCLIPSNWLPCVQDNPTAARELKRETKTRKRTSNPDGFDSAILAVRVVHGHPRQHRRCSIYLTPTWGPSSWWYVDNDVDDTHQQLHSHEGHENQHQAFPNVQLHSATGRSTSPTWHNHRCCRNIHRQHHAHHTKYQNRTFWASPNPDLHLRSVVLQISALWQPLFWEKVIAQFADVCRLLHCNYCACYHYYYYYEHYYRHYHEYNLTFLVAEFVSPKCVHF